MTPRTCVLMLTLFTSLFAAQAPAQSAPSFSDDFSKGKLDESKWTVMTYPSPGRYGQYTANSLDFSNGMLRIDASKTNGGGIYSKEKFGYGTYTFVMRMSSTSPTPTATGQTITGAVSSAFLYKTNSETEIDLEFLGDQNAIHITTWNNQQAAFRAPKDQDRTTNTIKNKFLGTQFRQYVLVWAPKLVQVYIDGTLVVSHRTSVPSTPASICIQHRAVNDTNWGGNASSAPKYFYVKSVTFSPLGAK